MDPETIVNSVGYIALGIAAWPICKYVFGPVLASTHILEAQKSISKEAFNTYRMNYAKTMEERTKVISELGKAGKSAKEISDIIESTHNLPSPPNIKFN